MLDAAVVHEIYSRSTQYGALLGAAEHVMAAACSTSVGRIACA